MRGLQRLIGGAALATYVQIVVGALVRSSESGLGCPDWPTCHGALLPPLQIHPLLEYAHRAVGTVTGLVILAAFLATWFGPWRSTGAPRGLLAMALVLVAGEGLLGGIAVLLEIPGDLIAVHLAIALIILALLLVASSDRSFRTGDHTPQATSWPYQLAVLVAIAGAFIVLISGTVVVSTGATEHCDGWPYCRGGAGIGTDPLGLVQVVHRTMAGLLALGVGAVIWLGRRSYRQRPLLRFLLWMVSAMLAIEVLAGAGLGLLDQPEPLKGVHVALAAAVWAVLVLIYQESRAAAERVAPRGRGVGDNRQLRKAI